jgi:hypothetical protein
VTDVLGTWTHSIEEEFDDVQLFDLTRGSAIYDCSARSRSVLSHRCAKRSRSRARPPHSLGGMRPRFRVGQRVRVTRASADWDAPIGALGTVASYDGANDRGTDWAVGFLQDGAEAFEPAWPVDESYLEADGPAAFEPLPFDAHCLAPDGAWMDEIITCLSVEEPADLDACIERAKTLLQPLVGGAALATELSWRPRFKAPGDILTIVTTWCGSDPWTDVVASLRRRFPESCSIIDDGWLVEFHLQGDRAPALFGPGAVDFRLFVEPWSSYERRPRGSRYPPSPLPPVPPVPPLDVSPI